MTRLRFILRFNFVLILYLTIVGFADAQVNRSTISGFIFGLERRPLADVSVEIRSEFSSLGRTKTDGSGRYYFRGLTHGRYTIKVLPFSTDYAEQAEDIEIAGMGVRGQALAENVQKDFYLKPRRGPDAFRNSVVYAQDVPKDAEASYQRAVDSLNRQSLQQGITDLEKAIEIFPTFFLALHRLGLVRLSEQRFDEAAVLLARAAAVNERCFECWYGISYARYSTRSLAESIAAGERAVVLKPDSAEANLLLGREYRSSRNFPRAEKLMLHAAKISNGASGDVYWNLALLYGKDLNRFADAADALEKYLLAEPQAPNIEAVQKLIQDFKQKSK
ncbi:MAG: tetratricopeptide repeat protein [bacterium]|nr:tetratricopeptide repeat protein [bacterium]